MVARSGLGFDESGKGKNLRLRPLHPDLFQNRLELLAEPTKGRSRLPNIDHAPAARHRPGNVCEHPSNWPVGKSLSSSFQYHLDALFVFSPRSRAAKFKKNSNGHGIAPVPVILKAYQRILVNTALLPKSGSVRCKSRCPLWANSGLMQRGKKDSYSITSSAVNKSFVGMVRPSALAAFKFITNSYPVGCWKGRSPGFSPRKIRSTYEAAPRYSAIRSVP
jgi:hypothetical protein